MFAIILSYYLIVCPLNGEAVELWSENYEK